jgi:hypothetical protein
MLGSLALSICSRLLACSQQVSVLSSLFQHMTVTSLTKVRQSSSSGTSEARALPDLSSCHVSTGHPEVLLALEQL